MEAAPTGPRDVMWVGRQQLRRRRLDRRPRTLEVPKRGVGLAPDKDQEIADIQSDPERLAFYLAIQQGPGEGHDQYACR